MNFDSFKNPLTDRYASREMSFNWSPQKKHETWRRLWIALAKAERKLGLEISGEQIDEMERHADRIDFARAKAIEKETRHDVMSHVHAFGEQCPKARPVIHLGATSCFVTDNTELIQLRDGLRVLKSKLVALINALAEFSKTHRDEPTLAFTHYQPAQLTTVGKRFCCYLQDFMIDAERLDRELRGLPFRSVKGTTGTQASFLALFKGDHDKVKRLERMVAETMGFENILPVSGQTYTRKIDFNLLSVLSGIAQSAYKMGDDLRLLANLKEIEEPFESGQVGSSAMAYKRNPMRSERICSLARFVMSLPANAAHTHATQWFERTLDDSANRRIVLPEAFLATDVILSIAVNVVGGLQVWPRVIQRRVETELPFMATENIMMAAVNAGGDRQTIHEAIRRHSMECATAIKENGADNDLLARIKNDPLFENVKDHLDEVLTPVDFTGRAAEQVDEFMENVLAPYLADLDSAELDGDGAEELDV